MVSTTISLAVVGAGALVAGANPQAGFIIASAGVGGILGGVDAYDSGGDIGMGALKGAVVTGAVLGSYVASTMLGMGAVGVFGGTIGGSVFAGEISGRLVGYDKGTGAKIGLSVGIGYYFYPGGPGGSDQIGTGTNWAGGRLIGK